MTVVVVQSYGDDGDAGVHGREEGRQRIGAAVVRHLEHIRLQVDAGVEQRLLRVELGVTRQQQPDPGHRRPDHE